MRRGILFVLSGASGVGKGSILSLVLAQTDNLAFSVSWTTRAQRRGERDGVDYHFKTRGEFEAELHDPEGDFLEHAEFVGNLYGTPRRAIEEKLAAGQDVILDIELEGAMQVRRLVPGAVLILVVPPNLSILHMRLLRRGTDTLPVVEGRLKRAVRDMARYETFDYVLVNDQLHTAVDDLAAIIRAERLRVSRIDPEEFKSHSNPDPSLEPELERIAAKIRDSGAD